MRRLSLLLLLIGLIGLTSTGCDSATSERGTATVTGRVVDAATSDPIPNATVFVEPVDPTTVSEREEIRTTTNQSGQFSVSFDIREITDVRVTARENNYSTSTARTVLVSAGEPVEVPTIRLTRLADAGETSGRPTNIILRDVSPSTIGIKESGSPETAQLTFQVADSAGQGVTLQNEALVRFTLGSAPGGAAIDEAEKRTNNDGVVTINISAGTQAGVVQVVAESTIDGTTIRSKPVSITIHGGLPDAEHFTLGPTRFNFPGLLRFGVRQPIGVLVGDKFGNPVKPNTAVYFSSNFGVMEGSTLTDQDGQGGADLISGNPFPEEDGVVIVRAQTVNEDQQIVYGDTPVLMTGFIVVDIPPSALNPVLGETYTFTATDENGNPLVGGTSVNVNAEGTNVKAVGNANLTLDDTAFNVNRSAGSGCIIPAPPGGVGACITSATPVTGPGRTQFTFGAVGDRSSVEQTEPILEAVTITVSGPNGSLQTVLSAADKVATKTKDARVTTLSDGTVRIMLQK